MSKEYSKELAKVLEEITPDDKIIVVAGTTHIGESHVYEGEHAVEALKKHLDKVLTKNNWVRLYAGKQWDAMMKETK